MSYGGYSSNPFAWNSSPPPRNIRGRLNNTNNVRSDCNWQGCSNGQCQSPYSQSFTNMGAGASPSWGCFNMGGNTSMNLFGAQPKAFIASNNGLQGSQMQIPCQLTGPGGSGTNFPMPHMQPVSIKVIAPPGGNLGGAPIMINPYTNLGQ